MEMPAFLCCLLVPLPLPACGLGGCCCCCCCCCCICCPWSLSWSPSSSVSDVAKSFLRPLLNLTVGVLASLISSAASSTSCVLSPPGFAIAAAAATAVDDAFLDLLVDFRRKLFLMRCRMDFPDLSLPFLFLFKERAEGKREMYSNIGTYVHAVKD